MSATRNPAFTASDHAVLRWSEFPSEPPSHEQAVDVIYARPSETLIRSASQVNEKTRVYLIKDGYTRIGIVKSCWDDQGLFLLEIDTTPTSSVDLVPAGAADPGVLMVDDFLTEEQENEILNDLGEEKLSRRALPLMGEESQAWRFVLDLQRLLRGISRSSTRFLPRPRLFPL